MTRIVSISIFILLVWIGLASSWYVCKVKGLCIQKKEKVIAANEIKLELEGWELMYFDVNRTKDGSISFQNRKSGQSVGMAARYLNEYPDKNISISSSDEVILDALLSSYKIVGVDNDRISYALTSKSKVPTRIFSVENKNYREPEIIESNIDDTTEIEENIVAEPIEVVVEEEKTEVAQIEKEQLKEIVKRQVKKETWVPCPAIDIKSEKPSIEYLLFPSASSSIRCNDIVRQYALAAQRYMDKNGGRIVITGHADADNQNTNNVSLGLRRAIEVKKFLIKSGISPDKIDTFSEGANMPIGDNATAAGKQLNRRVTIELY